MHSTRIKCLRGASEHHRLQQNVGNCTFRFRNGKFCCGSQHYSRSNLVTDLVITPEVINRLVCGARLRVLGKLSFTHVIV